MSIDGRLLIVEDDTAQREELAAFLRDQGAEVEEAASGDAALEVCRRRGFDVVLTDLRGPAEMEEFSLPGALSVPETLAHSGRPVGADLPGLWKHGCIVNSARPEPCNIRWPDQTG